MNLSIFSLNKCINNNQKQRNQYKTLALQMIKKKFQIIKIVDQKFSDYYNLFKKFFINHGNIKNQQILIYQSKSIEMKIMVNFLTAAK